MIASLSLGLTATAGISANNKIAGGDALLLGGEQPGWIDIDGQNRGDYALTLIIQDGESEETVGSVLPGDRFNQSVPKGKVLLVRNTSVDSAARVYWHISGYSSAANPRLESQSAN